MNRLFRRRRHGGGVIIIEANNCIDPIIGIVIDMASSGSVQWAAALDNVAFGISRHRAAAWMAAAAAA